MKTIADSKGMGLGRLTEILLRWGMDNYDAELGTSEIQPEPEPKAKVISLVIKGS